MVVRPDLVRAFGYNVGYKIIDFIDNKQVAIVEQVILSQSSSQAGRLAPGRDGGRWARLAPGSVSAVAAGAAVGRAVWASARVKGGFAEARGAGVAQITRPFPQRCICGLKKLCKMGN